MERDRGEGRRQRNHRSPLNILKRMEKINYFAYIGGGGANQNTLNHKKQLNYSLAAAGVGAGAGAAGPLDTEAAAAALAFLISWFTGFSRVKGRKVRPPMKGTNTSGTLTPSLVWEKKGGGGGGGGER